MKKNNLKYLLCFLGIFITLNSAKAIEYKTETFGSLFYAQSFQKGIAPFGFISTAATPDFTDFSFIGLNVNGKFNDEFSFFTEILSLGGISQSTYNDLNNISHATNFVPFAQFAYLKYQPTSDWIIKLGRQGYPVLMAAENFRKTFDQPYRSKPTYIYNVTSFSAFDGLSVEKVFDIGEMKFGIELMGGVPINDYPGLYGQTFSYDNMYGIRLNLNGDGFRIRAQVSQFHDTLVTPVGGVYEFANGKSQTLQSHSQNFSVGYEFKKFNIVNWGEYTLVNSPDGTNVGSGWSDATFAPITGQYYRRVSGYYELIGYQIGDFLPRYTYAAVTSSDPTFPGSTTSHTFGLNYNLNKNIVLKGEYELDIMPSTGGYLVNWNYQGAVPTWTNAVYLGADFSF